MEINISFSNVLVLRLLRKSVLILFMALKARSQSAVETGKATALDYNLTTRGIWFLERFSMEKFPCYVFQRLCFLQC